VQRFLKGCTDASSPSSASFTIYESQAPQSTYVSGDFHSDYSSDDLLRAASERFGPGSRRQWCEGAREEYCWDWQVDTDRVDSFVQFLSGSEPLPKHWIGPAELTVFFGFRWVEPRTKQLLPYQDPVLYSGVPHAPSDAQLGLSRLSYISLRAYFPFTAVDSHFLSFCDQIAPLLPTRLRAKHFRLCVPNKRGDGYVVKKLDPDLVVQIDRHLLREI
jgi:hypothetical protein